MIIPSIGKQKIKYKDHSNIKFESLDFYVQLAQKTISKFGGPISKEMIKSEDAISFVANAIMMGDWRWEKNRNEDEKKQKTLYSYRNQCAIWAIKTYVTKKFNDKSKPQPISMSHSVDNNDDYLVGDLVQDNRQQTPLSILIDQEDSEISTNLINKLFESEIISDKQKDQLKMYYLHNMTLEKIGNHYGVTREAVRQNIKSAIAKIREFA